MSGEIVITSSNIIQFAATMSAVIAIVTLIINVYKWYSKQQQQDKEINRIKEENALLCFAMSACLDGLMQLGANHTVPIAKDKLDKYLNKVAHE